MNKTMVILKNEIYTLVSRFSFWFGVLGLPLIGFLVIAGVGYINRTQGGADANTPSPLEGVGQMFSEEKDIRPQGFIDQSGLLKQFPDWHDPSQLIDYANENDARADLDSGKISAFYIIPADYLETGLMSVYSQEFNLISTEGSADRVESLINYNLLGGKEDLYTAISSPINELERVSVAPPDSGIVERDRENMGYFFVPYAVMMFFYISIMGSSGMLLNSVSKEKENRLMEVLLLSAKPHELLLGKVLGLGLVGLFQVVMWLGVSFLMIRFSGTQFALPASIDIPVPVLTWGVVFFILGYLIYASLMAGLGALVPNVREASQATIVIVIPLMIPLFLISALIETPNSPLSVGLSLFPLTAPTTMMLRLAATNVPVWQPILAIVLLIITSYFIVRAVAGMFRAQTLLSGQPFKMKRFFLALAGR